MSATGDPLPLTTAPGSFSDDPPLSITRDISQLRTRVYGKGHAEGVAADIATDEAIIPIADAAQFSTSGGTFITEAGQIGGYTGVIVGGKVLLAGAGDRVSGGPSFSTVSGGFIPNGLYSVGASQVGEDGSEGAISSGTVLTMGSGANTMRLTNPSYSDAGLKGFRYYRSVLGGGALHLIASVDGSAATVDVLNGDDLDLVLQPEPNTVSQLTTRAGAGHIVLRSSGVAGGTLPAHGWLIIGSTVVRYDYSGSAFLVPTSGVGAIVSDVKYGDKIVVASALTGVSGLTAALAQGDQLSVWVQRDDAAAQAEIGAIDGTDGVYEYPVTEDLDVASLIVRCDAELSLFSRPIVTAVYGTRDMRTEAGKTIAISLPDFFEGSLLIQAVSINGIGVRAPGSTLAPFYAVTASSVRFTLEELLQTLAAKAGA